MIIKVEGKCQYEDCDADAIVIASGRQEYNYSNSKYEGGHPDPAVYCQTHAQMVADENHPEYIENCPNCGCQFGVN